MHNGPLYYRYIENDKIAAVKMHRGNYDKNMTLSQNAKTDLQWWLHNIDGTSAPIQTKPITKEITTDASKKHGWGAAMGNIATGGAWEASEHDIHINVKEMVAVYYALRSFKDVLKKYTHSSVVR